jgi:arrestin-related trafficking adapter 4/5/7
MSRGFLSPLMLPIRLNDVLNFSRVFSILHRVSFSNSPMTYIVCNHEWSFFEGEKKNSHTLKAGRHLFPFQLHLGGSLPSTFYTNAYGGSSVTYKLRATATRPGFAPNLQTHKVITLLRSFVPEAVEYQQSLEIENTWPEKIMYSIMVPHKAWAAGDDLTAAIKLSPLAKGVRPISVVTTLNETIKVHSRTGWQESTRPVVTTRHEFRNGQAVWVEHRDHRSRSGLSSHSRGMHSVVASSCTLTPTWDTDNSQQSPHSPSHLGRAMSFTPSSGSGPSNDHPAHNNPEAGTSTSAHSSFPSAEPESESHSLPTDVELSQEDIATKLEISLPLCTTPTHTLEPIIASHRIRWSIIMDNPDGHTSELRCSLPLHILDYRLLDEAKSATAETRRLLLGGPEVPEEAGSDHEQLPSYPSHIRDRIANMYLPDQAVLRVFNPWIHQGISPVQQLEMDQDGRHSDFTSGVHTPLEAHYVSPPIGHGDLEYVNSELLLSLSQNTPPPIETTHRDMGSPPETTPPSRSASRRTSQLPSRVQSRALSRAPSTEREMPSSHHQNHSRRSSSGSGNANATSTSPETAAPSTYLHSNSTASRNLHGLFHATLRPLTSLTSSFALPSRHYTPPIPSLSHSSSSINIGGGSNISLSRHQHSGTTMTGSSASTSATSLPRTVPVTSHSLLHRAFTEVPDYDIASRGFLGGVTPLETLQGLPSYEEAEMQRSRSESDLASIAHPHPHPHPHPHARPIAPLLPLRSDEAGPRPGPEPSVSTH